MGRRESYHGKGKGGSTLAGFRDATSLEEAAQELKRIKKRKRFEEKAKAKAERPKPSLPKMPWDK